MGSILQSQCKCGYESDDLYLGGGMMNFPSYCEIPCYCDECEIVFSKNILTKEAKQGEGRIRCVKCRKKVSYYGNIVNDDYNKEYHMEWYIGDGKTYFLKGDNQHCPKCKKKKLQIYPVGNFD